MRPVRFVALGDSLTQGVGDPAGNGWRGWAALLAPSLAETAGAVEFTNLAVSGAQTRDVLERQTPAALELRPDLVSVVIGVNDTLRHTFDIKAVAARLDEAYAALTRAGATLLTACLPDPGAMLGLPGALARPLARRQRAVNTIVHALSERYGAVHLHAADGAWITDRELWSADRLHPGERGHRQLAVRFHALLTEAGRATGRPPSPEPEFPAPTRAASLLWLATAGTAWVARRCKDLLPQLLGLAADELHHRARGTTTRLDLSASAAVSAALATLAAKPTAGEAGAQRCPARTSPSGLAGAARGTTVPGPGRADPSGAGAASEATVPAAVRSGSFNDPSIPMLFRSGPCD
jgi:lysophospholipase L1-like esterase